MPRPNPRSRAALEQELERMAARVAELERERDDVESFAALAAHELLEPLVMAEAYAAMVSERLDESEHAESLRDLDALTRGAARVRLLVEALLHDARSDGARFRRRRVDLNAVVRDCVSLIEPHIAERRANVRVATLPEVSGDGVLLGGVFTNLLLNALRYNPRLGGDIQVGATEEPSAWRISVTSEGPTIPSEDRERIFEPFNRGRGERRVRGAGLGLAICRRIVERHGGRIGVMPVNGSATGNIFFFTLPS